MRIRKLLATLLLLCAPAAHHAQERSAPPAARLIDSFGGIHLSDLKARLDNFAVELNNDPGARGLLVAYAARHKFPGWPARRNGFSVDYLVMTRALAPSRLAAVNGGLREDAAFELWLVPPDAEDPVKPFDVALLMSGEKRPLPFDRFVVIERGEANVPEISEDPLPDDADLYGYFAEVLRRDPSLRGCLVGYTSWRGARGAGRRIASRAKLTIAKSYAVDVPRLVALDGGRRQYKMVELWLVPPGSQLPTPSPEPPPTRRRRR